MARRRPLGLLTLHRHEAHRRALRRLADGLGIGSIILLALDERLHIGGWNKPHLMARLADLAAPEVRAAAGFHGHNAGGKPTKKVQHLIPPQLLAQHPATGGICPVGLKYILRQIQSDRDNLRHDRLPKWIVAIQPWHTDAVGERLHHQSPWNGRDGVALRKSAVPVIRATRPRAGGRRCGSVVVPRISKMTDLLRCGIQFPHACGAGESAASWCSVRCGRS